MKKSYYLYAALFIYAIIFYLPCSFDKDNFNLIEKELKTHSKQFNKPKYAIVIDYSKPFFKKRLWVVDINSKETILNSHVSHAKNSGWFWATEFSNVVGSEYSSKGTFKTLNSYESKHGKGIYKIGMRIKGLNKGVNDNVLKRNIVFHTSYGFWSAGCFMTAPKTNKKIIDLTKNGHILIVI